MTSSYDHISKHQTGGPSGDHNDPIKMPVRRHRKAIIESDPEDDMDIGHSRDYVDMPGNTGTPTYNMDTDISKLEAPTFTTLDRGPSQTMIQLRWDHQVNLIGKKVVSPMIHVCDKCHRPILIYGRMIPCKHVFCFHCAKNLESAVVAETGKPAGCTVCKDKVVRVEQTGLGSIFMCSFGGTRYGNTGCRRTYLSQRDLDAHIKHRHSKGTSSAANPAPAAPPAAPVVSEPRAKPPPVQQPVAAFEYPNPQVRRTQPPVQAHPPPNFNFNYSQPPPAVPPPQQQPITVIGSTRPSNLITVPIQPESVVNDGFMHMGRANQPPPVVNTPIHQPPPNFYQQHPPPNFGAQPYDHGQQWRTGGYRR